MDNRVAWLRRPKPRQQPHSDTAMVAADVQNALTEDASGVPGEPAATLSDSHGGAPANPHGKRLAVLTLTALGVVYGDIGTSPLYTIKEAFGPGHGLSPTPANVYGILSLVFWAIILVVVVKYLLFILRADNRGEGGVLALLALVQQRHHRAGDQRRRHVLVLLGVFGPAWL